MFTCLLPFISFSQWDKVFGGTEFENGFSAKQTSDGGYILTGATESFGAGGMDIWLIKTDTNGDTLWTKTIGGTSHEEGLAVIQSSNGGYVLTAKKGSFPNYKSLLIKTDTDGDTLWTKTFGGNERFAAKGLQQTNDGGYIISGSITTDATNGPTNIYLIKTDANGDTLWTKTYGASGHEYGIANQTSDGGYIISGMTTSFGNSSQLWLVRTDNVGDTVWTKVIGGMGNENGQAIETSDNGFIIVGNKSEFSTNSPSDVWIVKTDNAGNTLWTKTYGGSEHDAATSVEETSDNGFIIGANTYSYGNGESDYWLLRTDNLGDTLWTRTFGGALNEYAGECHQTYDGGYIFMGYNESFGNGNHDLWLIKLDENGFLKTSEINNPIFNVYPNPVENTLFIENNNSFGEVESIIIYNLNGKIIKSFESWSNELDVTELLSGLYLITFITDNGKRSFKFVKK